MIFLSKMYLRINTYYKIKIIQIIFQKQAHVIIKDIKNLLLQLFIAYINIKFSLSIFIKNIYL
jgi:hypothetical protein